MGNKDGDTVGERVTSGPGLWQRPSMKSINKCTNLYINKSINQINVAGVGLGPGPPRRGPAAPPPP